MARRPGRPPGLRINGDEVYRLRVEVHKISATELAARVGCTPAWIWEAENGTSMGDVTANRLAAALGVEVKDITIDEVKTPAA